MSDPKRFRLDGDGYYIKSAAEMRELWEHKHGMKEACDNTLLIAERCEVAFAEGANLMPRFPVPEGESDPEHDLARFRREMEVAEGDLFSETKLDRSKRPFSSVATPAES